MVNYGQGGPTVSFGVYFIDGPHAGTKARFTGVDSPEDMLGGFDRNRVHYEFTGTVQPTERRDPPDRRVPEVVWDVTKDPVELFRWWQSLTPSTRAALSADPAGPVPSECLTEVIGSGQLVSAQWWTASDPGPNGFYLPDRVQQWIVDHPLGEQA